MESNPILNVDINGDSIVIWFNASGRSQVGVTYRDGKLYNEDGSLYTGKGVKVMKDGSIKITNSFLGSVVSALKKIEAGGAAGAELISNISNNIYDVNIRQNRDGENATAGDRDYGSGVSVWWNPNQTSGVMDVRGNTKRPVWIGLAHELAHGWDKIEDGATDENVWYRETDADGKDRDVFASEKYATWWENRIRSENNVPLREFYSQKGNEIPESRILQQGTSYSLFYYIICKLPYDYSSDKK